MTNLTIPEFMDLLNADGWTHSEKYQQHSTYVRTMRAEERSNGGSYDVNIFEGLAIVTSKRGDDVITYNEIVRYGVEPNGKQTEIEIMNSSLSTGDILLTDADGELILSDELSYLDDIPEAFTHVSCSTIRTAPVVAEEQTSSYSNLQVTQLQHHDLPHQTPEEKQPVDIEIDHSWFIQRGTDGEYSIPTSNHAYANEPVDQDNAHRDHADSVDDIATALKLDERIAAESAA